MLHLDDLDDRTGANVDLVAGLRWAVTHNSFANDVQQSSRTPGDTPVINGSGSSWRVDPTVYAYGTRSSSTCCTAHPRLSILLRPWAR
jgi:hypothetical protein